LYSTCLFCSQPLGVNETLESFPVGRRVAFDTSRGRLWVVCRKCERWNLSPIEERWETIEDCERLFRDTRARVSTDQIGLARMPDRLELVRIGKPLRPEFAAWRYGDQFGRRRKRTILYGAGAMAAFGALVIGGAVTGVISASVLAQSGNFVNIWVNGRTVLKLRTNDDRVLKLKLPDLQQSRIMSEPGGFSVSVGKGKRREIFAGEEAERVVSQIVPKLNSMGGKQATVQEAVRQIEEGGGPEPFLRHTYTKTLNDLRSTRRNKDYTGLISKLPGPTRLAVEMALHEERERRALEGELMVLEEAWQEAEEIAAISDDLVLPPGARSFIESAKASRDADDT
jgi:hypothetical protein